MVAKKETARWGAGRAGVRVCSVYLFFYFFSIYRKKAAMSFVGCRSLRSMRETDCLVIPMISASSAWVRPRDWRICLNSVEVIALFSLFQVLQSQIPFGGL